MPKTSSTELLSKKRLYKARKVSGICVDCGQHPAKQAYSRCETCLQKRRDHSHGRLARGLCPKCGKPRQKGYRSCKPCRDRDAARADKLRKDRRAALLCILCGKEQVTPPYTICEPCRIKKRKREGNYRLDGGNREAIIIRDNSQCQLCNGIHRLRVHHKDGTGNTAHPNNDPANLITICQPCHSHLHAISLFCKDLELLLALVKTLQT